MDNNNSMGKRIAALRKEQGLTQEALAEKVGVSAQAVSKWENDASCPDINTLPLLASIFGISTDELLGVKPVEPHVVVVEKEKEKKPEKENWNWEWNVGGKKHGERWFSISCCITAILVCLYFIIDSLSPAVFGNFGNWSYIWPILVFGWGLIMVREHRVIGSAVMACGVYKVVCNLLGRPEYLLDLKWYVILLIVAVVWLLGILFRGKITSPVVVGSKKAPSFEYSDDNDILDADISFGSEKIVYAKPVLRGANIDTSFGEHTIDLTGVETFADNTVIDVDINFGSVKILLPANVLAYKDTDLSFGSAALKGTPDPEATQKVYIRGDVNFASLEVSYPQADNVRF
ncbi:MAG: helix-turn-helix domain-containing protein [Clostridia bacterium]|nr:helix-turn-helix domain-containing protein [Clostridia bacterium]